ncbi:FKBP-type peptidyl-prolyl cis-trans isomerase [Luteolibacter pohnpeiensis]|uniref:Peptidyl-prolyl cis-trans isomerase n=1 Tax=Luteolibacter pohnpeiensis TaxID=454153 RepID=A0A934S9A6_9BACT|nr:FKBP-type peptidyl-prolyl cis-trans isomerase [Luteolibacter pohnpeiensis]MBK1882027.1 FKBP-type peptidyl-prolyl cis-trans isomerase [Luteolibacter pohnpeiensis]
MIRKFIPAALVLGLAITSHAQTAAAEEAPAAPATEEAAPAIDPATVKTNASYALGYQNGRQLASYGIVSSDLDIEAFKKGFLSCLDGAELSLSQDDIDAALTAFGNSLQARETEKAAANLKTGQEFLAENGKREGVKTTESGLQYEVLTEGKGQTYKEEDGDKIFMVNYKGSLISGKEFDKSPEGEPVAMTLQVIPGFKEALTSMPVGSKWKVYIPSDLAYGESRSGADIAPNSVLIFELELVEIQDAPESSGLPFPMPQGH